MRSSRLPALLLLVPMLLAAETPREPEAAPGAETGAREATTGAREALEIEVRQAALRFLEADIARKLQELLDARKELDAALKAQEGGGEPDLTTLIDFYSAMKPKNAAVLLEKLPSTLAADVLGAMSSRAAGKILNVMNADKAVRISKLMAGDE